MQHQGVKPNVVTWNTFIAAYGQQGQLKEAQKLLKQMQQRGVKPDVVTWNALISAHAYGHSGRLKEAQELFQQMQQQGVEAPMIIEISSSMLNPVPETLAGSNNSALRGCRPRCM